MTPPAARPWTGSPYRRRRILWTIALLTLGTLFLLISGPPSFLSFSLPTSLKDASAFGLFSPSSSRAGRLAQAKAAQHQSQYAGEGALASVRELDALLHFVLTHPERRLDGDGSSLHVDGLGDVVVDPGRPVDLRVYDPDGADEVEWEANARALEGEAPLVVFSKSYCPYSKLAKEILASYDIRPAPKIVELDMRSDGSIIQAILLRLTGRKTVPNILLGGQSIGGATDINAMNEENRLKKVLEDGGLTVTAKDAEAS